ncbi:MAG: TetR/AcrR family transcriptional regulator [Pseudomonadota bacterium]
MPSKRDQRLVQSEKAIIEAAIKTFLLNPDAGMSEIAQESGVGRTTLYRHYDSKQALVQAVALQCLEEIDKVLEPVYGMQGRQAIEATFELLLPVADRYRFLNILWSQAERDPLVSQKMDQSTQDMAWLLQQAQQNGEIDPTLPLVWLTTFFDMTLYAAWDLLAREELTTEDAVRFAARSFFSGCGTGVVL